MCDDEEHQKNDRKDQMTIIANILKLEPFNVKEQISYNTVIKKFPDWDSLKHLRFFLQIEAKFGIKITPEDFQTIKTIEEVIKKIP